MSQSFHTYRMSPAPPSPQGANIHSRRYAPYPSPRPRVSQPMAPLSQSFRTNNASYGPTHELQPQATTAGPAQQSRMPTYMTGGSYENRPPTSTTDAGMRSAEHVSQSYNIPGQQGVSVTAREAVVTQAANAAGLQGDAFERAHKYISDKWDTETKIALLNVAIVGLEEKVSKLIDVCERMTAKVDKIQEFVDLGWVMKEPLENAVKELMYHMAIKPADSADSEKMVEHVVRYIFTHPRAYELEGVQDNQNVRATITQFVKDNIANCRSAVRKEVFELAKSGVTLKELTKTLTDKYHLPPKPAILADEQLAHCALMRKVAAPLVGKPNKKGQDTGFWKKLDYECRRLYQEHGETNNRATPAWRSWQATIIAEDEGRFRPQDLASISSATPHATRTTTSPSPVTPDQGTTVASSSSHSYPSVPPSAPSPRSMEPSSTRYDHAHELDDYMTAQQWSGQSMHDGPSSAPLRASTMSDYSPETRFVDTRRGTYDDDEY